AMPRPIPPAPPVISAVLREKLRMLCSPLRMLRPEVFFLDRRCGSVEAIQMRAGAADNLFLHIRRDIDTVEQIAENLSCVRVSAFGVWIIVRPDHAVAAGDIQVLKAGALAVCGGNHL